MYNHSNAYKCYIPSWIIIYYSRKNNFVILNVNAKNNKHTSPLKEIHISSAKGFFLLLPHTEQGTPVQYVAAISSITYDVDHTTSSFFFLCPILDWIVTK